MPDRSASARRRIAFTSVAPANGATIRHRPGRFARRGDHEIPRWIVRQPALMAALHELRGKDLVCWCASEHCHADVLIELANG
jgi:Domain of unknown function (DUF4326)